MSSIVIALPKIEDARKIRTILSNHGFAVAAVCSTAARALSEASQLEYGILVCGYRLPDMYYHDIAQCLPKNFELLLLASEKTVVNLPSSVLSVKMPMKVSDLINTINMVFLQQERRRKKDRKKPKPRSFKEQNYISNAKMLLMQRNHLSEEEAYRYIQKCSMDSGTNMVETAQMILMLIYDEV